MFRKPLLAIFLVAATVAVLIAQAPTGGERWVPERPLEIIVPWPPGGSTDQITRLVAAELAQALEVEVRVHNRPGGSGSAGVKEALTAPADGYTWASGSAATLGLYPLLSLLDTSLDDWRLLLTVANPPLVSVRSGAPYRDFSDLLRAMRERPESVTVATAGSGTTGHKVAAEIAWAVNGGFEHRPFEGGRAAVDAVVAGEVDVTAQLASEQVELIRKGDLRPLAVFSEVLVRLEGIEEPVPPVIDRLPELPLAVDYFGIWVRADAPERIYRTLEAVWADLLEDSEAIRRFCRESGARLTPYTGEEALGRVLATVRRDARTLERLGLVKAARDDTGSE